MARGEHIYVRRRGVYTHHGVDAGDGTVIHFTGEPGSKRHAAIARTPIEEFLSGGECRVRRYGARDDADVTIARAESQLDATGYHLAINNCEHFATWCCTGRKASEQVRGATSLTAHGAVAGGTFAASTGIVGSMGLVAGVSGPGIMSGLASAGGAVGAGAAMGPAVLGVLPATLSVGITRHALRDDASLPSDERDARRDGRWASVGGAGVATAGGVVAISATGTAGLSAAGITTGLAAIGATVGGGMAAGTAMLVAAPAVAAAGLGLGAFAVSKKLRRTRGAGEDLPEGPGDPAPM
ncbi:MAG: lecithin retinol acyltransferase family protein [Patulibacter sp.]|nr:lecithin retinol acyltransferase family protein [Patulibacter sp.]